MFDLCQAEAIYSPYMLPWPKEAYAQMNGEKAENLKAADKQNPAEAAKRERSTIEFPYGDLEDAVTVAKAVHSIGGQSCTVDQLAAYLKQSAGSGAFRLRLSFPRIFGLTEMERGTIRLTELGLKIVDPSQEQRARVDAFLKVPLYKAIYDKYKGYTLPPPAAMEREMANLGVSSKQTDKARQVFDRSARYAGFFALGPDRLVIPPLKDQPETRPLDEPPDPPEHKPAGGGGGSEFHPFIQGLLATLPKPETEWPAAERAKWLQTAASIFGLIYKGGGSVKVTVDSD